MESFEILCECGTPLRVSASEAGTNATCACGRIVPIPSFSDLKKRFQVEEKNDDQTDNSWGLTVSIIVIAALFFVVWLWDLPSLAFLVFVVMFSGGKMWFLAVMFREMGTRALLVFIIPFLDWAFLFMRFDVAWKPVLFQFIGLLFLAAGGILRSM